MKRIPIIFAMVILGVIVTGGCVQQNSNSPPVPPTQTAPLPVVSVETMIPQGTVVPPPAPQYKTADLKMKSGTEAATGFTMDYPSEWTYGPERLSWPSRASPVYEVTGQDSIRFWKAAYNFSSPDKKLYAHVYFDDVAGTGDYYYPIHAWADGVIREKTLAYCLDSAGNPLEGNYCSDARMFFHPVVISNDPVTIPGSFEARKLVFTSYDDENYGLYSLYLMHSGQMQGYNFTIPDHPEVAVEVYGPAWDFGRGGEAYAIDFHTPRDQVNTTADIFNYMINSFKIT